MASLVVPYCIAAGTVVASKYGCHAGGDGLVYCSSDSGLVYEQRSGQCTKVLVGHTAAICSIVYISQYPIEEWPEEPAIATLDCTGAIGVWSVADGRCLLFHVEAVLRRPVGMVHTGGLLVVGDAGDGKLVFLTSLTLELVYVVGCEGLTAVCGYAPHGTDVLIVVNTTAGLRVFSIDGHRAAEVASDWLPAHADHIASSSDSKYLLVSGATHRTLYHHTATTELPPNHDDARVVLNDGRMLKTVTFDLKIQGDFFSPSSFAQASGQVVVGGQSGQYCVLTAGDLISKKARRFHQGPFRAPISAILAARRTVWMGTASGCLFSFDVDAQDRVGLVLRIARSPIIKLIEFGDYLLAVSHSLSIAIINLKSNALLYSINHQPAPIALRFGIDDCVLVEQVGGLCLKLDLTSRSLHQVAAIDESQFGEERMLLEREPEKDLLHPLLHMLPHGLLKVLHAGRSFPGALLTLDIRALVSEVMIRREPELVAFSHSLLALLRKPDGVGIVGAGGNVSVSLADRDEVSAAEAAITHLTAASLAIGLGQDPALLADLASGPKYPSLSVLSKFWCDFVRPLEGASRAILKSILASHHNQFEQAVVYWQERLASPPRQAPHHHIAPMNRAAIILAILTLFRASDLLTSPALAKAIGCSLFAEVEDERRHLFRLAAVQLFGKCYSHWEAYVDGPVAVRLLFSWLSSTTGLHADPWTIALLKVSRECIADMLAASPDLFNALCADLLSGRVDAAHCLSVAFDLVKSHPAAVDKHICLLAETVVRALDPSSPRQRARLLPTATPLLYEIVMRWRRVAFNSARQLLASGRLDGVVSVWDAGSGVRMLKSPVHSQPVSGVLFDQEGLHVVSYSFSEGVIAVTAVDEPSTMSLVFSSLAGGRVDDDSRVVKRVAVPEEVTACISVALLCNHHRIDDALTMHWVQPSAVRMCVQGGHQFVVHL